VTRWVVVDTTVWSNFAQAGDPRLVQKAFSAVASPSAVMEEIRSGQRRGYLAQDDWDFVERLELTEKEKARSKELEARLGPGEAACLAVAEARGCLVLTDDRAARKLADSLDVRVSGTIGVLVRLVDSSHISVQEADGLLKAMVRAGYRSPVATLTGLI
jgi:predicted nucleic acid-binding protein